MKINSIAVLKNLYSTPFSEKQSGGIHYDAFLSFAEEDVEVAEKIYSELTRRGLNIWFSREHLRYGQSIIGAITKVIQNSNSAIVVLSVNTFADDQHFPLQELKALQNQSIYRKLLLFPIYHGISHDFILDNYPMLSDQFACNTNQGIDVISEQFTIELERHKRKS